MLKLLRGPFVIFVLRNTLDYFDTALHVLIVLLAIKRFGWIGFREVNINKFKEIFKNYV